MGKILNIILFVPFSLLGVVLIGMGMYELVAPLIPFGPLGMVIAGAVLLLVLTWFGVKKILV